MFVACRVALVYFLLMLTPQPRFRLLGPLEVQLDGSVAVLTGRQRALCAMLLLRPGRVVSVDRLVQGLWGERLPSASAARVRALVAEVRRALGPAGTGLLATLKPGYVLRVAPSDVDVFVFEDLVREGSRAATHGAWAEAYRCHDEAVSLWQEDPLPDLPTMEAERRRLTELRIAALEGRAEADLELGRYAAAIAELVLLTSEYPLREHPHALLMRALQRDGRTSEALAVYTEFRRRMVDELGVDPSDELEALHRRLLTGDAKADAVVSPPAAQERRVPRQLPRAPHRFVGRSAELRLLDQSRLSAENLSLIVGPAGAGKTALALHWAHRIASGFPDGQLFLDMRGFDAAEPMTPEEALPLLLQGLGSAPRDIPLGLEAQTALYRTLVAERQVLIVLDDVADASVVRRLLPASSGSLTVVTSRHKMSGLVTLDGAHRVVCDVLDSDEAMELLSTAVGPEAVAADPEAAARLVELCDHLPLALCVAGSWVGDRPGSIAAYVHDLAECGRLARLHVEGEESVAVRAALDLSYGSLPDEAKWVFRSLGLMAGTGRSVAAAAAGAGLDAPRAADLLGLAQRVHLLRDTGNGRPTWHDLVHEYARERVVAEEEETERQTARDRILDHYLQSVANAAEACGLYVSRIRPDAVDGSAPRVFQAQGDAFDWFDGEWDDIAAAVGHAAEHGPTRYAWQLVDALQDLFHHRRPLSDWIRLAHLARRAAEHERDALGQAAMCLSLGHARWRDGDLSGALGEYQSGELLACQADWLYGEAACLQGLGVTLKLLGEPHKAPPYYRRTISLYRTLGMLRAEKIMLVNTASLYHALGRLAEAEEAVAEALALTDEAGDHVQALALVNLALVWQKQARFEEAKDALRRSLLASRDSGSVYAEAVTLETLGRVRDDAGQDARAIRVYEDALHLSAQVGNRNCQVDSLVGLASVKLRMGVAGEAAEHLDTARDIAEETGHLTGLVEILLARGVLSCAGERYADALTHLDRAADMAAEGNPLTLPRIRTAAAVALLETGELDAASSAASEAADLAGSSGQRLVRARALVALAAVHEASGDLRSAQAAQDEAQDLFAEIGTPSHLRTAAFWRTEPGARHTGAVRRRPRPELPTDAESRHEVSLTRHFDDTIAERAAGS